MTAQATAPFVTFFVGDAAFAADAADISEVFRQPAISRIPGSPPSLLGMAGLRGTVAPVVSLASLLGGEEGQPADGRLLLLDGDQPVGLAVSRVGALTTLPAPVESEGQSYGRIYSLDDDTLRAVDLGGLLRRTFAQDMARRAERTAAAADLDIKGEVVPHSALLAFDLDGQAYAFPLDEVVEVMPLPEKLRGEAQSIGAAPAMLDLGGRRLPVASLRELLGLAPARSAHGQLVVVRIGGGDLGLLVDRLNAILRAPANTIDAAPPVLNRGTGPAQVQSIGRLGGGAGLVAILSVAQLLDEAQMAAVAAGERHQAGETQDIQAADGAHRYLVFRTGEAEYGLPLVAVEEVARLPDRLTRVPQAPAFVKGVLTLRGRVIPVIDRRSPAGSAPALSHPRILVTAVEGQPTGFIVDAVSEIVDFDAERMTGVAGGAGVIQVIEPKDLLDRAERELLAVMEAREIAGAS